MYYRIIICALLLISCGSYRLTKNEAEQSVKTVTPKEFDKLMKSKSGILLDVRTSEEFEESHLENAINIDVNGDDFENQINRLNKDSIIYLYCHAGGRSLRAAKIMANNGFTIIYNLDGGITDWKEEGRTVTTE